MKKALLALAAALLLLFLSFEATKSVRWFLSHREVPELMPHMNCVLDIGAIQDTTHSLLTGYHYNLLRKFASDNGKTVDISLSNLDMNPADSLLQGSIDLVVMPFSELPLADSTICSIPIDSSVVWVMRESCSTEMVAANLWLDSHLNSPEDSTDRTRFFHPFGYHHSGYTGFISPYDSLMKVQADSIGWDWRMLATVIYIESWFHIEARSYRGAEGLLQLMPVAAKRFGSGNTLDPEESIAAGAKYLATLARRYKNVGDNMSEWFKYTVAAYNAGEGRIDDCIKYARYRGKNPSYWINVEHLIPEMRNDSIKESGIVRHGVFKGYETIAYVEQAVRIYNKICAVCPE